MLQFSSGLDIDDGSQASIKLAKKLQFFVPKHTNDSFWSPILGGYTKNQGEHLLPTTYMYIYIYTDICGTCNYFSKTGPARLFFCLGQANGQFLQENMDLKKVACLHLTSWRCFLSWGQAIPWTMKSFSSSANHSVGWYAGLGSLDLFILLGKSGTLFLNSGGRCRAISIAPKQGVTGGSAPSIIWTYEEYTLANCNGAP